MHHLVRMFIGLTLAVLNAACGGGGGGGSSNGAPAAATGFTVSVSVSGIQASQYMEFTLNSAEAIPITGSGSVTFGRRLSQGEDWNVAIQQVPIATLCSTSPERGTVANTNVSVTVTCSMATQSVTLVKDVNEQATDHSSNPRYFSTVDSQVVFTASRDTDRQRLYSTGGSPGDVVPLVDEDLQFPIATSTLPGKILYRHDVGESNLARVQFSSFDSATGRAQSLASIEPAPGVTLGDRAFFFARDVGERYGFEPWISDGTPAGTRLVKDIYSGPGGSSNDFTVITNNDHWFFIAYDGSGNQLWTSDGTEAGTQAVSPQGRRVTSILGIHQGRLFYVAGDSNGSNTAVWSSNGIVGDELLVQSLSADGTGTASCFLSTPTGYYYVASVFENNLAGTFLWHSSGTGVGPRKVLAIGNGSSDEGGALLRVSVETCGLTAFNGKVWFAAEDSNGQLNLWATDGTAAGTRPFASGVVARNVQSEFFLPVLPDKLVFPRSTAEHGRELWWTDGNRLELLEDIVPGPGSSISNTQNLAGIVHQGKLYFVAETPGTGAEPWVTNGTSPGTQQLGNITAETRTLDGVQSLLGQTTAGIFFSGCSTTDNCELWISDGSTSGTRLVVDLDPARGTNPRRSVVHADCLYFTNDLGGLWQSDGTEAGTRQLSRVTFFEFHSSGNTLLFSGDGGGGEGVELWRTDGTETGTYLLADVATGRSSSRPAHFVSSGNWVSYRAREIGGGISLWRTDPASGATERVAPLNIIELDPRDRFVELDGNVVVPVNDAEAGAELWQVSGLNASRIADINPGPASSFPSNMTRFGNEVFFRARDASAYGLWAFDSTNVRKVFDVTRDERDEPGHMRVVNGRLYMNASTALADTRLHVMDSPSASARALKTLDGDAVAGAMNFAQLDDTWVGFNSFAESGWRTFVTDGARVIQLDESVDVVTELPITVSSGNLQGIWFVGKSTAKGQELWRVR